MEGTNKNIIVSLILNGDTMEMLRELGASLNDSSRSSVVRKAIQHMYAATQGTENK